MSWDNIIELILRLNTVEFTKLTSHPSLGEEFFLKKTLNVFPVFGNYANISLDYYNQIMYKMDRLISIYINDNEIMIDDNPFITINLKEFDELSHTLSYGRPPTELISNLKRIKEMLDEMG